MVDRVWVEQRIANLRAQRQTQVANLNALEGGIAILEEVLAADDLIQKAAGEVRTFPVSVPVPVSDDATPVQAQSVYATR